VRSSGLIIDKVSGHFTEKMFGKRTHAAIGKSHELEEFRSQHAHLKSPAGSNPQKFR
jgi:hypothetical protein